MPRFRDLSKQKFNSLRAIKRDGHAGLNVAWQWQCDCGNIKTISGSKVTGGEIKTCGECRFSTPDHLRHGEHLGDLVGTRFYNMFFNIMQQRCYNPNHKSFKDYGARGITVCASWLSNPRLFIDWCEQQNPDTELTLARKENHLGYSPENCVFATRVEQNRNRRNARFIETPKGRMLVSEAAREFDIATETLRQRVVTYPNNPELWFIKPSQGKRLYNRKS